MLLVCDAMRPNRKMAWIEDVGVDLGHYLTIRALKHCYGWNPKTNMWSTPMGLEKEISAQRNSICVECLFHSKVHPQWYGVAKNVQWAGPISGNQWPLSSTFPIVVGSVGGETKIPLPAASQFQMILADGRTRWLAEWFEFPVDDAIGTVVGKTDGRATGIWNNTVTSWWRGSTRLTRNWARGWQRSVRITIEDGWGSPLR